VTISALCKVVADIPLIGARGVYIGSGSAAGLGLGEQARQKGKKAKSRE